MGDILRVNTSSGWTKRTRRTFTNLRRKSPLSATFPFRMHYISAAGIVAEIKVQIVTNLLGCGGWLLWTAVLLAFSSGESLVLRSVQRHGHRRYIMGRQNNSLGQGIHCHFLSGFSIFPALPVGEIYLHCMWRSGWIFTLFHLLPICPSFSMLIFSSVGDGAGLWGDRRHGLLVLVPFSGSKFSLNCV